MRTHTLGSIAGGVLAVAYSVLSTQYSPAADWPQFRGPNGSAVSNETGLPLGFTEKDGLRWKAELPGRGVSSPVVVGGKVFVTCTSGANGERLHVVAYDAGTGAKLWHRQFAATGPTFCHPDTCMAAPTPVADESGVYTLFACGDLAAFDHDGTLRWYRSFVGDYPTVSNQVGGAASPVLVKDRLVVPMDNAGESFVAAIDVKTGKNVWKTPRPRDVNWVTPAVRAAGGKTEILLPTMKDLIAYDADTGAKLWSAPVSAAGIPSPTVVGDVLLFPGRGLFAHKIVDGKPTEAW
jgi:outer membrane protein assembly factor BamB